MGTWEVGKEGKPFATLSRHATPSLHRLPYLLFLSLKRLPSWLTWSTAMKRETEILCLLADGQENRSNSGLAWKEQSPAG